MSDQGIFTPGADPNAVPLPIAGPNAYQHGQWWTSAADGFVAGRTVYKNERIWGLNYRDLSGSTDVVGMEFQPEGVDGRHSLNCDELSIQIGFSDPSTNAKTRPITMEEIAQYVRGFRLRRGRSSTWYDTPITTLEIECDDSAGFFGRNALDLDPLLRRGAPVTVDATWRNETFPLFRGSLISFVEPGEPGTTTVLLQCQDDTYKLASPIRGKWTPGVEGEYVHERVAGILDKSTLGAIVPVLQPTNVRLLNAPSQRVLLDEITVSTMSSGMAFFFDNDGVPTLLADSRVSGRDPWPGIFTDQCSPNTPNLAYTNVTTAWADHEFGNNIVVNNVTQGEEASVARTATDQQSIDTYGVETWAHPQLAICYALDLQQLADWELARRKDAFYRVTRIRFNPANNDRAFFAGLSFKLGTAMYIFRTPTASESALQDPYVVEGITIQATGDSWTFDLFLSPALNIGSRKYGEFDYGTYEYGGDFDATP